MVVVGREDFIVAKEQHLSEGVLLLLTSSWVLGGKVVFTFRVDYEAKSLLALSGRKI